jgi:hypothetical protein
MKSATEMPEEGIRERAYHLWESSGRPPGRDQEFWQRACEQIAIEGNRSTAQLPNATAHGGPPAQGKPIGPIEAAENPRDVPDRSKVQRERQSTPRRRARKV